jgi:hypothetical protein
MTARGVPIFAIQSKEFGFGVDLMDEQLERANRKRKGEKYKDENAAISKFLSAQENDLPCSPFIKELEYSTNNEGYWHYEWMVLQFKGSMDCVMVLYLQDDYVFLFDQSCGNDKQWEDDLNAQQLVISERLNWVGTFLIIKVFLTKLI